MEGIVKDYLLASDFDQTLSFNDSGLVLSELVGIPARDFERKTALLSAQNLICRPKFRSRATESFTWVTAALTSM